MSGSYLFSLAWSELHLLGAGDVVDARRGGGRVRGPGGTPHRGDGGQVTAMTQHRDLDGTWWWDETTMTTHQLGNTLTDKTEIHSSPQDR